MPEQSADPPPSGDVEHSSGFSLVRLVLRLPFLLHLACFGYILFWTTRTPQAGVDQTGWMGLIFRIGWLMWAMTFFQVLILQRKIPLYGLPVRIYIYFLPILFVLFLYLLLVFGSVDFQLGPSD